MDTFSRRILPGFNKKDYCMIKELGNGSYSAY